MIVLSWRVSNAESSEAFQISANVQTWYMGGDWWWTLYMLRWRLFDSYFWYSCKAHTYFNGWYMVVPLYKSHSHYNDVIMSAIASQITSRTIVYSAVYSGVDQRKHQSSASLASVGGIHLRPVNSRHKGPVTWKMFPFDDVVMSQQYTWTFCVS